MNGGPGGRQAEPPSCHHVRRAHFPHVLAPAAKACKEDAIKLCNVTIFFG